MMNTTQATLPVRIPPPPGRRPLAVFLVALSLSIGWGIRGNFGHEAGAMIPGALAALAACLLSGREDWRGRAPWFALFGGLGVVFVSKNWKIAIAPIALMLALFIFVPAINAGTVGIMVPVGVLFTLGVSRILYKKKLL